MKFNLSKGVIGFVYGFLLIPILTLWMTLTIYIFTAFIEWTWVPTHFTDIEKFKLSANLIRILIFFGILGFFYNGFKGGKGGDKNVLE